MVKLPFRSSIHFRHARVSRGISRAIEFSTRGPILEHRVENGQVGQYI